MAVVQMIKLLFVMRSPISFTLLTLAMMLFSSSSVVWSGEVLATAPDCNAARSGGCCCAGDTAVGCACQTDSTDAAKRQQRPALTKDRTRNCGCTSQAQRPLPSAPNPRTALFKALHLSAAEASMLVAAPPTQGLRAPRPGRFQQHLPTTGLSLVLQYLVIRV